jgi:branched-chain amino acid transport system substrate-binding protein
MQRRYVTIGLAAAGLLALAAAEAGAQEVVKIGMSFSMTGAGFNAAGRQAAAGARLYVQQHGNMVAGKKIEMILRDDAGVADNARRLVQEMIVNDKVQIIGGGITPTAPRLWSARDPGEDGHRGHDLGSLRSRPPHRLISCAPASFWRSPSWIMGEWAAEERQQTRSVTLVNEWAPGTEAETALQAALHRARRPDRRIDPHPARQSGLCAVLQRIRDINPGYAFIYFPARKRHLRQAVRRARPRQSGIRSSGQATSPMTTSSTPWVIKMLGIVTAPRLFRLARLRARTRNIVEDFQEGEQLPSELCLGWRLRRHASHL